MKGFLSMVHYVVCVRDRAVEAFGRPVFAPAPGFAIRSFQDEINRDEDNNMLHMHPDDHDLYLLGSWDDATGLFDLLPVPKILMLGKQATVAAFN